MPSVRQTVQRNLRNGTLTPASPLEEVKGIGRYLAARLARALGLQYPITILQFWSRTNRLSTNTLERTLHRALQNARGNQCVSTRIIGRNENEYHTGDVNELGYEACVALLDFYKAQNVVRYNDLPSRLPKRSSGSMTCGCRPVNQCNGMCVFSDGACIPRTHNTRGFVGVSPHPNQKEYTNSDAQRRRVRQRSRTRLTNAVRNDPDSARDIAAGHARAVQYSRRGSQMWRRPGSKVRLPARA